jgi:predicted branched-subunit amino acid permease
VRRFAAWVFGAAGIALLPWTVWLSASLPPHHRSANWDLAWSGFDSALAMLFLATAFAAWRRRPWLAPVAAATGALLIADAWFDVVLESRSDDRVIALAEAFGAELPLAALCFAVAYLTSLSGRRAPDRA